MIWAQRPREHRGRSNIGRAAPAALLLILFLGHPTDTRAQPDESVFLEAMVDSLASVQKKMIALAEATPPELYSWRPTEEVRSMSELYMHVVGTNFQIPAALGAAPPEGVEIPVSSPYQLRLQRQGWEKDFREKDVVVEMLKGSFDYALAGIPQVTNLEENVAALGFRDSKLDYLHLLISHGHEHLGQAIAYARSSGVVPPWSQRVEPVRAESVAVFDGGRAHARVVAIDGWGNLVTDLVAADLERLGVAVGDSLSLTVGQTTVGVLFGESVADVGEGEWFAILSPSGLVTIGRSYQNAQLTLNCEADATIVVSAAAR